MFSLVDPWYCPLSDTKPGHRRKRLIQSITLLDVHGDTHLAYVYAAYCVNLLAVI